jgi:hypothetical protein
MKAKSLIFMVAALLVIGSGEEHALMMWRCPAL